MNSLQSLKNNLSNVIVVGLIVAAFKKTIGFEVNNATDLLALCGSVAMQALSAWLILFAATEPATRHNASVSDKTRTWSHSASTARQLVSGCGTAREATDRPH